MAAQALVHPQRLKRVLPDIEKWQESSVFIANIFSGLIPALIYTAFFAVCPALFKVISNFGSNATSSVGAGKEFHLYHPFLRRSGWYIRYSKVLSLFIRDLQKTVRSTTFGGLWS